MARKPAPISCPLCNTKGDNEQIQERNVKLERGYRCKRCNEVFYTLESVVSANPRIYVLAPYDPKPRPFDPVNIREHLDKHLRKLLTAAQRERIVERIEYEFPRRLLSLERMTDRDFDLGDAPVYDAQQIREVVQTVLSGEVKAVEPHLRDQFSAAAAAYRLTEVGLGLPTIAKWLHEQLSIGGPVPAGPRGRSAPPELWRPPGAPPEPTTVVKNFREDPTQSEPLAAEPAEDRAALRLRRERVTFRRTKLHSSIDAAIGTDRHDHAMTSAALTRAVESWVLWSCHGQPVVRSSQLSAYIAGALRRCAPIAYLRWVIVGKELRVDELHDEVRSLIESPPVRLTFPADFSTPGLASPPGAR